MPTTYTNQFGNTTTTNNGDGGTTPYPPTSGPASISLSGPPVANVPAIETSTNVSATALALFQSGGRPTEVVTQQLVQWQGASLVLTEPGISTQSPAGVPGFNYSTIQTDFNEVHGITSTQQYVGTTLSIEDAQQGTNVVSNVTTITSSFGGVPAAQIAVFRFQ
jgi:hypothetical protein